MRRQVAVGLLISLWVLYLLSAGGLTDGNASRPFSQRGYRHCYYCSSEFAQGGRFVRAATKVAGSPQPSTDRGGSVRDAQRRSPVRTVRFASYP
jgi:hypothetical protein